MIFRQASVVTSAEFVRPLMLTHGLIEANESVRHAFFTREGGVSTGVYASLNTGVGSRDDRGLVFKNRARAATALGVGATRLATPYQVHGATTVVVEEPWRPGEGPQADAVVTNRRGIAVGVGTADCGPVLLADGIAHVVGAAHAGWKGALAGIIESAIAAMETLGARRHNIVAVLGPTISGPNYEIGPEVIERFTAENPANNRFFRPSPRPGHANFDLPGYIVERLSRAGVAVADLGLCTYADDTRFFSYRRATHRGESDYGRMLSAITLVE